MMKPMNPRMKTRCIPQMIVALAAVMFPCMAFAEPHQDHGRKIDGPNGGRVITTVEPHLEFFVTADRKVRITALDEEGRTVDVRADAVRLIGVDRMNPTRMTFRKDGKSLISDKAFPEGNRFPVVLQIKFGPDDGTVYEKFMLNLDDCAECKHKEYACVCQQDDHKGHDGHDH